MFDISGELDLFLKAYVTIDLFITSFTLTFEFPTITLFTFSVDFTRPSFLGDASNGTLTLAIGPSSKNRLQGDLTDTSETIHVAGQRQRRRQASGRISSAARRTTRRSSPASRRSSRTAARATTSIDLSGLNDTTISVVVHGGDGNDTLIGPKASKCDATTHICAQLFGDGGNDTLTSASNQMRPARRR